MASAVMPRPPAKSSPTSPPRSAPIASAVWNLRCCSLPPTARRRSATTAITRSASRSASSRSCCSRSRCPSPKFNRPNRPFRFQNAPHSGAFFCGLAVGRSSWEDGLGGRNCSTSPRGRGPTFFATRCVTGSSMSVEIIAELDDPRLEPFRNLKATNRTRWTNQFVAEGSLVVERLLASRFQIQSILVSRELQRQLPANVPPDCPIYFLEHALAEQLVGYSFHTGVLACGLREPSPPLAALVGPDGRSSLVAVCPNVNDPENIGAISRLSG